MLGIELLYARLHMIWDHDHAMKCKKMQVSEKNLKIYKSVYFINLNLFVNIFWIIDIVYYV